MIRGTKKQVIVLRTRESRFFDAAYFVLRERAYTAGCAEEVLAEASRIVSEATPSPPLSVRQARRGFLRGALFGASAVLLTAALVLLPLLLLKGGIF